jgi:dolichol-phosphate mannosyltransferase
MKSILYIIVPVLNEAPNLPRLSAAFRELAQHFADDYNVHFLLIDDGSTDHTAEIATQLTEGLSLTVLRHEQNQGPGRAFATAYTHLAAKLQVGDWVATMEGDNTSRHELLGQMMTRTREGYEVILASPYAYGGSIENTQPIRVILSHVANAFLKGGVGIHGLHTMSSFFRLHSASTILRLQQLYGPGIIEHAGFDGVVEMLMKMVTLRVTISEIPMVLDTSRRLGKSKMKVMKTIMNYFTLFFDRSRWTRLARSEMPKLINAEASQYKGGESHPSFTE